MARPAAIVPVPTSRTTIVLAMDVSRSMCATDIPPNRLVAAEEAAASFVESQDGGTQIGIVAFAGFAEIVQAPTNDEEVLLDVIASLATGRRTAIGSAILESIDAIAEIDPSIAAQHRRRRPDRAARPRAVPEGAYAPAIIVLLTDGASNAGPEPVEAAQQAADRGMRVYTIGFGTEDPGGRPPTLRRAVRSAASPATTAQGFTTRGSAAAGSAAAGGGFRRGDRRGDAERGRRGDRRRVLPRPRAPSSSIEVFAELPTDLITSHEVVEISVAFTAVAVVLVGARDPARPGLAAAAVARERRRRSPDSNPSKSKYRRAQWPEGRDAGIQTGVIDEIHAAAGGFALAWSRRTCQRRGH